MEKTESDVSSMARGCRLENGPPGRQITYIYVYNRRFRGRGHHLVSRAKNSDGLGRVIVSV